MDKEIKVEVEKRETTSYCVYAGDYSCNVPEEHEARRFISVLKGEGFIRMDTDIRFKKKEVTSIDIEGKHIYTSIDTELEA